jgi:hypothetical protein
MVEDLPGHAQYLCGLGDRQVERFYAVVPHRKAGMGVRRDKAALSSGCEAHPAIRSSRKQPEQAWRRRNV